MDQDTFLVSSFELIPDRFLMGLCFQDEDLILGNEGYEKYRAIRGKDVQPGQDGAYIVLRHDGAEIVVGTDFSGYAKIFLYRHGPHWALSNSFIELARFAAGRNLPVTLDEAHLSSFFMQGSFGRQLTSLHTSIKEIQLVPSTREVVITRASLAPQVLLRPTSAIARLSQPGEYAEALRDFVKLWAGRMATVLRSDLNVVCELSGGRDSRAALALMLAADRRFGGDLVKKIGIRSNQGATRDFAVASQIADEYGLTLIDDRLNAGSKPTLPTDQAYEKWKALCLGVYAPIYFPRQPRSPREITFSGGGGEGHRPFYTQRSLRHLVDSQKKFIPTRAQFQRLKADILGDLTSISQGAEANIDPLILHYRHFRDRCHGGCLPQYTNKVAPLASGSLRRASSVCSPEKLGRSQILADILMNADEKLAFIPYDDPKKNLDARHIAERVDASGALDAARGDGHVFASDAGHDASGSFVRSEALHMLRDDFLVHYERVRGTGFFPRRYLEMARRAAEEAAQNGSLPHATVGVAVAHVILAGELLQLSTAEQETIFSAKWAGHPLLDRLSFWRSHGVGNA